MRGQTSQQKNRQTCVSFEICPHGTHGRLWEALPDSCLGGFGCFDAASGSSNWNILILKIKYDFLYEKEHVCCLEEWSSPVHQKIYTTFILVILFLLPLMVMLILYSKIGYELWIKKRVGDGSVLRSIHGKEMSKIARCVAWNIHLFKMF